MLKLLESWVISHKELITLGFTLGLIAAGVGSALIAYLSVREMRRQRVFQEWAYLSNIHNNSQLALLEFRCKPAEESGQQKIERDVVIASLEGFLEKVQERITKIENRLSIKQ